MTALDLRAIARALDGEVSGRRVLAPGPQHSPKDRSLCVSLAPALPGGFLVHSFAGDTPDSHILAAVAQHERERIAQHTKDALQAAKLRGNPRGVQSLRGVARALAARGIRTARRRGSPLAVEKHDGGGEGGDLGRGLGLGYLRKVAKDSEYTKETGASKG